VLPAAHTEASPVSRDPKGPRPSLRAAVATSDKGCYIPPEHPGLRRGCDLEGRMRNSRRTPAGPRVRDDVVTRR
jgi:hypothetical protein